MSAGATTCDSPSSGSRAWTRRSASTAVYLSMRPSGCPRRAVKGTDMAGMSDLIRQQRSRSLEWLREKQMDWKAHGYGTSITYIDFR